MAQPNKPTVINLDIKGLFTNPSPFGDNTPNGALTIADNVVIDRPSVVETRRGFGNDYATLPAGIDSLLQYASTQLAHAENDTLYGDPNGDGTFTAYNGTYSVPDATDAASRVRGIEINKNLYFITSEGTYRLDDPTGTPRLAGAPAGLSGEGVVAGDPSGFLPASTAVAYRVVFGYRDANDQLILGAPSSRIIVLNNTAGSDNVDLTFQVPQEIQADPTSFFFQVYRSNVSPNLTTEPDDAMRLTFEDVCTGTPTITINDITPVTLLGPDLYTNQGQQGILQANFRPPWAKDICAFKQFAFYANTRTPHTAEVTLIAAGASNGPDAFDVGDTITFTEDGVGGATFTLTGAAANNFALGEFAVSNTGSPGFDIQQTAANIALVANAYAANTFLAGYYTSTGSELPGQLRFDRLSLTEVGFSITTTQAAAFEQAMPVTSVNEARPNRIYFSKFNQPEAVPPINFIEVGSANQPIERIVALRDGVMVLKQDGIFRVSNNAPPFVVTGIDFNVRILAPNTAAELDNKVYFLSDQGVVALTDSDAQVMSFVLDRTIIQNTSPTLFPNLRAVAFGVAYQSDRKYILAMPTSALATQSTQQYVYNHFTEVWTRWTLPVSCGQVFRKTGRLYFGTNAGSAGGTDAYILQERKTFTQQDYADEQFTLTNLSNTTGTVITVNDPTLPVGQAVEVGDTLVQGASRARITSITDNGTTLTLVLNQVTTWTAGNVILYKPIATTVRTIQMDCDNPGMNKQFSEIVYIFTQQSFSSLTARLSSDIASVPVTDTLTPIINGGWGIDPWGTTPWGGSPSGQGKIRRYVAQNIQRAGWIFIEISNAEAFTSFGLSGLQLFFNATSSRQR